MMDPTERGDRQAELLRSWYEHNRETWWDRHRPNADRNGTHADEWMLGLMQEMDRIFSLTDAELMKG